ncbi:hypothetical protein HYZ97_05015 [Candidatus Pacearchaeota archaeon]|nr:hypothetical protein [Candidatus Pacearchaeota archaeon]
MASKRRKVREIKKKIIVREVKQEQRIPSSIKPEHIMRRVILPKQRKVAAPGLEAGDMPARPVSLEEVSEEQPLSTSTNEQISYDAPGGKRVYERAGVQASNGNTNGSGNTSTYTAVYNPPPSSAVELAQRPRPIQDDRSLRSERLTPEQDQRLNAREQYEGPNRSYSLEEDAERKRRREF